MQAGQTTLKPLIEGRKQYRVPIFQRPYIWDGPEVIQLWEDMTVQYRALRPAAPGEAVRPSRSTRFLGGFVLAPLASPAHGVTPYLIVDGQQRLATVLLALAALRDVQAKTDRRPWSRFNQLYLRNEFAEGLDRYTLLPTQLDREAFFACSDGEAPENGAGRIFDTYHLFRLRLSRTLPDDEDPLDLADLERVIIERLAVVEITVEHDDNPHRIVESLTGSHAESLVYLYRGCDRSTVYPRPAGCGPVPFKDVGMWRLRRGDPDHGSSTSATHERHHLKEYSWPTIRAS